MSSDGAGGAVKRRRGRVVIVALALAGVPVWMLMMQAAGRTWFIDPTDGAIAKAAAARPETLAWALLLTVWAVLLSWATRRRWLGVLALPGLVVALTLLGGTRGDGGALFAGLAASVAVLVVVPFLELRRQRPTTADRARARSGQHSPPA